MTSGTSAAEQTGLDPQLDRLMAELTVEEKVALLSGRDVWSLAGVARLGIPVVTFTDGPAGARGQSFVGGRSVSFPCETSLGASWDPALVRDVGRAIGQEARRHGARLLLAPTVNLHRHPLAGRNFECFSEDPELTSEMASAYITGVQSAGVGCCVKHLVCNDSEHERHTASSVVDETALREVYLAPFEAAVRSGVWSIMAAYNRLNGTYASEHPWLLGQVLRDEWGFDGVVVSDWFATHTTEKALLAGLDVEMPGPPAHRGVALHQAIANGRVPMDAIDRSVRRVLRTIARAEEPPRPVDGDQDVSDVHAVARRSAARGMVLLANRGVLPLRSKGLRSLALIGPNADSGIFQGGGSAQVNPESVAGILPALERALGPQVPVIFERGCVIAEWPQPLAAPVVTTLDGEPGVRIDYRLAASGEQAGLSEVARAVDLVWIGSIVEAEPNEDVVVRASAVLHPQDSGRHELVVFGSGAVRLLVDGELVVDRVWECSGSEVLTLPTFSAHVGIELEIGTSRIIELELQPQRSRGLNRLELAIAPPDPPDLLERAVAAARECDAVVVLAQSPHGWESEGRDRPTMTLPGRQDELIAAVLAANPATVVVVNSGAAVAMPWVGDAGAVLQMWFPGEAIGSALADVLTGVVNPSGRLPMTIYRHEADAPSAPWYPGSGGEAFYGEGLDVGYRGLARPGRPTPVFAFGHGLSYSTFELGTPLVRVVGTTPDVVFEVVVPVRHRSGPGGREVVQVYVSSDHPDRPPLELKGFAGVDVEPGQETVAVVAIPVARLLWWRDGVWQAPDGTLVARVGTSSSDLPYSLELPPVPPEACR